MATLNHTIAAARDVYFDDPNGHLLEIITRSYGSAGTAAARPHPLVAPMIEPHDHIGPDDGLTDQTNRGPNSGEQLARRER